MGAQPEEPAVYWVDEAGDVEIRNGIVCWSVRSGGLTFEMRAPISVLRESIWRSIIAYRRFLHDGRTKVVRIARKRTLRLTPLGIDE
jgi:hypothetical protein